MLFSYLAITRVAYSYKLWQGLFTISITFIIVGYHYLIKTINNLQTNVISYERLLKNPHKSITLQ